MACRAFLRFAACSGGALEAGLLDDGAAKLDDAVDNFVEVSRTSIFSPLTRVMTVSGACSTSLIRSEFTVTAAWFNRVS